MAPRMWGSRSSFWDQMEQVGWCWRRKRGMVGVQKKGQEGWKIREARFNSSGLWLV